MEVRNALRNVKTAASPCLQCGLIEKTLKRDEREHPQVVGLEGKMTK
jgi:hypothetical protein